VNTDSQDYVQWFRQSSPYINAHRGKTFVLMLSGEALAHDNFQNTVHDIALLNSLGVRLIIVHGARPQIDALLQTRNIEPRYHGNKRITDNATLEVVQQAVGQLRAQIEARLSAGMANSPMHGADIRVVGGNLVIAKPIGVIDGVDLAHTGEVRRIDTPAVKRMLDNNAIVLLNCLGYSRTGEVFNLSVEDVATQTAISLQADKLIMLGEKSGLHDTDGNIVRELSLTDRIPFNPQHLDDESLRLFNCAMHAVQKGVSRCHLISYAKDGVLLNELFTLDGNGTLISHSPQEQLRAASIEDVGGILELLAPLEEQGILVRRSREMLENEIDRFMLLVKDGMVLGCAALYSYENNMAELACVAIHLDYQGGGRAERLLRAIEKNAKQKGIEQLFVLTTRTAHWFVERGFKPAGVEALPEYKKQMYNFQRNSKVFIKSL
jgi:amino-acid N-acetyltransferase